MPHDWTPGADLAMLRRRADMLQQIRGFFARRNVLEVETPCLVRNTASDEHLESFSVAGGKERGR